MGAAGECDWVKDGSADLFIAAEAAQWFDMAKWGQEAAQKLRSGGTVAMIYYGCNATIIDPPEAASHCNKLFSLCECVSLIHAWIQDGLTDDVCIPFSLCLSSVRDNLGSDRFPQECAASPRHQIRLYGASK